MKPSSLILIVLGASLSTGCAAAPKTLTLAPVGPPPTVARDTMPGGNLIVYTLLEANDNDYEHPRHTAYQIFADDGHWVRSVRNRSGSFEEDPALIRLPAGRYKLVGRASGYGQVTVPVVIATGRTTAVYLDGGASTPARAASAVPCVRLPDGAWVGWRAEPDAAKTHN